MPIFDCIWLCLTVEDIKNGKLGGKYYHKQWGCRFTVLMWIWCLYNKCQHEQSFSMLCKYGRGGCHI